MTNQEIHALKNLGLSGKNVNLRIAKPADAEFILELRLNPLLNKFISETEPDVEKQRTWLRNIFNKITNLVGLFCRKK